MNKINQIPFTIVIPVFNEFSNIEILCNELKDVLKNYSSYEIFFVNYKFFYPPVNVPRCF